ncbi:MAG: ATP-dependent nuclease [Planctomycetota bacterium]|jgi:ABC-type cobalamin/Fe3+-siderophores transport system ATPase subunit
MKIKAITLERFRQFRNTTFEVGAFNLLVGPNNSGKTTVLHAIRAFFLLMSGHVRVEGDPPKPAYHRRFLSSAEEIAPTPEIRELWYKQEAGKPLSVSVTFDDDTSFSVVLRQQFGQIHVSAAELPVNLSSERIARYLDTPVAYIPGLVGVLVSEPYATTARRNSLATQGRYSEIFRSSLEQIQRKTPKLVGTINRWLKGLFGVEVTTVSFDHDADEFVTVKYTESGSEFDVVSSGSGVQQVIQMLTNLYLSKPRILLIDEPDAHLHSRLQSALGELFRRVAKDLDAQVFLSTHSLDLIDTFNTNEVIVIDSGQRVLRPLGHDVDLVSTLVDANIVDVSALSRILASRKLVVVEDKDQTVLKAFDKAIGSPLYSSRSDSYVLPAKGSGNFRALAALGNVLTQIIGRQFDLSFLQDRDGMPDFLEGPFLASQGSAGINAVLLGRHEIESYLLEPQLMESVAVAMGMRLTKQEATRAILKSAQGLKAAARRQSRESAKQVNRHLPADDKMTESKLEVKVDQWFDSLDLDDLDVIRRVFPGKELLAKTLEQLNEGKSQRITRGKLVAAVHVDTLPEDIENTVKQLAGMKRQ